MNRFGSENLHLRQKRFWISTISRDCYDNSVGGMHGNTSRTRNEKKHELLTALNVIKMLFALWSWSGVLELLCKSMKALLLRKENWIWMVTWWVFVEMQIFKKGIRVIHPKDFLRLLLALLVDLCLKTDSVHNIASNHPNIFISIDRLLWLICKLLTCLKSSLIWENAISRACYLTDSIDKLSWRWHFLREHWNGFSPFLTRCENVS